MTGESVHVQERRFVSQLTSVVVGQGIAVALINLTCIVLNSPWRWGWHRG